MQEPSRTRRRIDYIGLDMEREIPAPPERPRVAGASDTGFPGWKREGEFLYRRRLRFPGLGVQVWPLDVEPEARAAEDLVFYDTETTGLSGGSGSVIFLFGAAWCEGIDLAVEQLFLSDFPGEPEFLLAVKELLAAYRVFVSYNGKTFDSHLLRSRFLMNRIEWEPGPQLDLLHHARRLWRSVTGECNLTSIERGILGFHRELDVAGEDIPLIWLAFLRSGVPGTLPVVFDHNVMDITSLARMYTAIGRLYAGDVSSVKVDERALGTWLLGPSPDAGATVLSDAWERGNSGAGAALSLHLKRQREWDKAVKVWESMIESSRSLFAAVELAKHHEHRARRPDRALEMVDLALSWGLPLDAHTRQEFRRRRERLLRKIERHPGRAGDPEGVSTGRISPA
jgi:uncharacterized protein YprB with RNaseH-like and TPR domain